MNQTASLDFKAIILAAGKGSRMRSALPKVMHKIAGRPMISHVLSACGALSPRSVTVVIAPGMESVMEASLKQHPACSFAVQTEQLGTGDAVRAAASEFENYHGAVLVLYGDTPLITQATMKQLLDSLGHHNAKIAVLGMRMKDPTGYGRLLTYGDVVERIVECKDACPAEKAVTLCNSGVMAFSADILREMLGKLKNHNASSEYYLTDIIELARSEGHTACVVEADEDELMGVNTRAQLAEAESHMQQHLREMAMLQGVTMVDPSTVYLSVDTIFGQDVVLHPFVVIGPDVMLGSNVEVRSFCHLEGATIAPKSILGPYARIRPGSVLEEGAHIGNFVEIKKSLVGKGAKVNHLSYVGDAVIGAEANIGAGTITCNYDGSAKHRTEIGAGTFIGSNTSLVAPVKVGDGALVAAGSVITEDVAPGALAIARQRQTIKPEGVAKLKKKNP